LLLSNILSNQKLNYENKHFLFDYLYLK